MASANTSIPGYGAYAPSLRRYARRGYGETVKRHEKPPSHSLPLYEAPLNSISIKYQETTDGISSNNLLGFFVGWPNPPSPENHLKILDGSDHCILAVIADQQVVGFISAISDNVSCAYIPHLEVLPDWQGKGIGTELVKRMVDKLKGIYMIDLLCDKNVQAYYEKLGFRKATGMAIRNYERQGCE